MTNMTPQKLIAELEKPRKNYPQGVLTWEVGDVAIYFENPYLVHQISKKEPPYKDIMWLDFHDGCAPAMHCTHSADDPRLLGRVLRELESHSYLLSITGPNPCAQGGFGRWYVFIQYRALDEGEEFVGDTLLEAALKALLAKVEGEKK